MTSQSDLVVRECASHGGEWPLVTLALLTYNQEEWVDAAMAGLFSQDYPNLEIIVSDDCSDDRTFERLQQKSSSYQGPHRLIVRKTEKNCGSLLHVADVARIARGELLVLAAGDDVSRANRVTVLQDAWKRTGAWGLCSRYDLIDAEGRMLATGVQAQVLLTHGFDRYFVPGGSKVQVVHGCTSAYDKRAFHHLQLTADDYVLSEDGALSVLLNLLGKQFAFVQESLVLYRQSANSLTNNAGRHPLSYAEIVRDEANILRFARAQANRCRLFLRLDDQLVHEKVRAINLPGVTAELDMQEIKAKWYEMSVGARVVTIARGRVPSKWAIPRLLGTGPFFVVKWLVSRMYRP